jgi:hypothetical protein
MNYEITHISLPLRMRAALRVSRLRRQTRLAWVMRSRSPQRWRRDYLAAKSLAANAQQDAEKAFFFGDPA